MHFNILNTENTFYHKHLWLVSNNILLLTLWSLFYFASKPALKYTWGDNLRWCCDYSYCLLVSMFRTFSWDNIFWIFWNLTSASVSATEFDAADCSKLDCSGEKGYCCCQGDVHGWTMSCPQFKWRPGHSHGKKHICLVLKQSLLFSLSAFSSIHLYLSASVSNKLVWFSENGLTH